MINTRVLFRLELVDKYSDTLKDFGVFTVETLKPKSKKGGRPVRIAWINEKRGKSIVKFIVKLKNFKKLTKKVWVSLF